MGKRELEDKNKTEEPDYVFKAQFESTPTIFRDGGALKNGNQMRSKPHFLSMILAIIIGSLLAGCFPAIPPTSEPIVPALTFTVTPFITSTVNPTATQRPCQEEILPIGNSKASLFSFEPPTYNYDRKNWSDDSKFLYFYVYSPEGHITELAYNIETREIIPFEPVKTSLQIYFDNLIKEGKLVETSRISISPKGDKAIYAIFRYTGPTPTTEPCTPPYCPSGEHEPGPNTNDFYYIEEPDLKPVFLGNARGDPSSFYWSPNEDSVIFVFGIGPSGSDYVSWLIDLNAKKMSPFLGEETDVRVTSVSPNGRWVLYQPRDNLRDEIWEIDRLTGTNYKLPVNAANIRYGSGAWFQDENKKIYMRSIDDSFTQEATFLFDFSKLQEIQISERINIPFIAPIAMSPDFTMLAFEDYIERRIYILKLCLMNYLK